MIRIFLIISILLLPLGSVFATDEVFDIPSPDFLLISPANGESDVDTDVYLVWQFVDYPDLTTYQLEIHRSGDSGDAWVPIQTDASNGISNSRCPEQECSIGVLAFANTISIDAGGYGYQWRVIAQNSSGDGIASSQEWGFTTKLIPPDTIPLPDDPDTTPDDPDSGPGPVNPPVLNIFQIENPISSNTLPELIGNLLNFIFGLSIVIAPLSVLYAGFLMLTAAGDAAKLQKARTILIWTVIAFAIILVAKGAPEVIRSIL